MSRTPVQPPFYSRARVSAHPAKITEFPPLVWTAFVDVISNNEEAVLLQTRDVAAT